MPRITISYRRNDSDAITGRIFDRLVLHFGTDSVFRDIDNIPPGVDFRKHINKVLDGTDVLLAVVGPQWIGKSADGQVRIKNSTDLVRAEVSAALVKDIPVVPILVGNATMPDPNELPEELQDFPFRNAVKVDALEDFDDHVRRLIRSLDRMLNEKPTKPSETAFKRPLEQKQDFVGNIAGTPTATGSWSAQFAKKKWGQFLIQLRCSDEIHELELSISMLHLAERLKLDGSTIEKFYSGGRKEIAFRIVPYRNLFKVGFHGGAVLQRLSDIELKVDDRVILSAMDGSIKRFFYYAWPGLILVGVLAVAVGRKWFVE